MSTTFIQYCRTLFPCCFPRTHIRLPAEPSLLSHEQEAVTDLLKFLENRPDSSFFEGEPLRVLRTLSYSNHTELQKSAALAFAEVTERYVQEVGRQVLEPIIKLLDSSDVEVQRASSAALGNLAVNQANKLTITKLNSLPHLIRQMQSPNLEVQCNAVGCITNLATHPENKKRIAQSGAFGPLIRLAKSVDIRVQRNATGALLNMTHSEENRHQLVHAGAIPILISLLMASDTDVQYYCTTALSNIAVDANNRKRLGQEPVLVEQLIVLMSSPSMKIQCQAALALRNLASDEKYQLSIVTANGLPALLKLLSSPHPSLLLAAVACIRNISIHHLNESAIVSQNFLPPLIALLNNDNEEIQCHAISTIRNLAAGMEEEGNKERIIQEGGVDKILEVMGLKVNVDKDGKISKDITSLGWQVLSEMTAAIAVLALSDNLKPKLLELNMLPTLLLLVDAPVLEVQGNAAAAIGNLVTNIQDASSVLSPSTILPSLLRPLTRFLTSNDPTFEHIALWTILQLVSSTEILDRLTSEGWKDELVQGVREVMKNREGEGNETGEEVVALGRKVMERIL